MAIGQLSFSSTNGFFSEKNQIRSWSLLRMEDLQVAWEATALSGPLGPMPWWEMWKHHRTKRAVRDAITWRSKISSFSADFYIAGVDFTLGSNGAPLGKFFAVNSPTPSHRRQVVSTTCVASAQEMVAVIFWEPWSCEAKLATILFDRNFQLRSLRSWVDGSLMEWRLLTLGPEHEDTDYLAMVAITLLNTDNNSSYAKAVELYRQVPWKQSVKQCFWGHIQTEHWKKTLKVLLKGMLPNDI